MQYDILIVGAGAVGLATAYQLLKARPQLKLGILEKEESVAAHQTGHNSGVIHSGIYYKPGSLKAQNCVGGYNMLLSFCDAHDISYDICGKIILATENKELPVLEEILKKGRANGLSNLEMIGPEQIQEIEPNAVGVKAIKVPQTGIIDYKAVAKKLKEQIEKRGGEFFLGEEITEIASKNGINHLSSSNGSWSAKLLINCGGLYADRLAQLSRQPIDFRIIPFRGEYYAFKEDRKHLIKHLIYPVPNPDFPWLGVHFTRMMNGMVEAGPNAVLAFQREGYEKGDINWKELGQALGWTGFQKMALKYWKAGLTEMYRSYSKQAFVKALQKMVPEVKESDFVPAPAGVRALACGRNGELLDDFVILEKEGVINVGNAPSPAATSCLSIGLTIAEQAFLQLP